MNDLFLKHYRLLINTPDINGLGGVANHYKGLLPYWNCNFRYHSIGKKKGRKLYTPISIIKYIHTLLRFKPDVVLINPSLGNCALKRDYIYFNIAKALGFKVSVFIHGFNLDYAANANWNWIARNLNKASHVIVLAHAFKDILVEHGVTADIQLSTTKVPDSMIEGFDVSCRTGEVKSILFLSRLEIAKGVFEAVRTYSLLKVKYPYLKMRMVGDGSALTELKQFVGDNNIQDITFTGELRGQAVIDEYKNADFFFFTSHGEGMPNVVLEAMAFGIPIVTRAVGGLCDFFEDGKMGRMTDSKEPEDLVELIEPYLQDRELTKSTSLYNHRYAKEHFLASKVARQLEDIIIAEN